MWLASPTGHYLFKMQHINGVVVTDFGHYSIKVRSYVRSILRNEDEEQSWELTQRRLLMTPSKFQLEVERSKKKTAAICCFPFYSILSSANFSNWGRSSAPNERTKVCALEHQMQSCPLLLLLLKIQFEFCGTEIVQTHQSQKRDLALVAMTWWRFGKCLRGLGRRDKKCA